MTLTPDQINALEAAAMLATPPPWERTADDEVHYTGVTISPTDTPESHVKPPKQEGWGVADCAHSQNANEDSTYIALCDPTTILELIRSYRNMAGCPEAHTHCHAPSPLEKA